MWEQAHESAELIDMDPEELHVKKEPQKKRFSKLNAEIASESIKSIFSSRKRSSSRWRKKTTLCSISTSSSALQEAHELQF
jgi:hypothetical protein